MLHWGVLYHSVYNVHVQCTARVYLLVPTFRHAEKEQTNHYNSLLNAHGIMNLVGFTGISTEIETIHCMRIKMVEK